MKVLSLFDGISCGREAFKRAGIPVSAYYASEIDKWAIAVSEKNWPEIIRIGDVNGVDFREYDVDIVIGGSPCQDLSIAKQNRLGLRGERSGLFWKYVEALEVIRPRWFLLENVASMCDEDRDAITETLRKIYPETECIMINAALVSGQQRKRYYWINWHVDQPEDKHIILADILEDGLTDRGKSRTVISSVGRTTTREYFKKSQGTLVFNKPERVGTLAGLGSGQANRIYSVRGKSVCLNANGGGSGAKTGLYRVDLPDGEYTVRKLTPVECERLMTLPDGYTAGVSNAQRYKMLGNGWVVDVIAHILKGIK